MRRPNLLLIILGISSLFLILSLGRSIWLSRQAHQEVESQQQELESLRREVQGLEQEVQQATSSFELERRIREELLRQKLGETVIEVR